MLQDFKAEAGQIGNLRRQRSRLRHIVVDEPARGPNLRGPLIVVPLGALIAMIPVNKNKVEPVRDPDHVRVGSYQAYSAGQIGLFENLVKPRVIPRIVINREEFSLFADRYRQ